MKHYVGLDVSQKEVSLCVVDGDGVVIAVAKVATTPALVLSWIEDRVGMVGRIVRESGPLSIWLTRELARTGWYREVHIKSEASNRLRLLLGARERMIHIRQNIEGQARGILKTCGIRLGPVAQSRERAGFREQLHVAASGDPLSEAVAASLIAVHDTAFAEAAAIEEELQAIARESALARRLISTDTASYNSARMAPD
jgi:transposase